MKNSKLVLSILVGVMMVAFLVPCAWAESKVIELTWAGVIPPVAPASKLYERWGGMVEEKSGGKVKFTYYHGGSLLKHGEEMLRGVQTGIADIGYNAITERWGFGLNSITELPFLGWNSMPEGAAVYQELLRKFPELQKEYKGLKYYAHTPMPPNQLNTAKKLVRVPSDLKGMKLYASGYIANLIGSVGGAPVQVGVGDWFISLNTGLIEGLGTHYVATNVFKCMPLVPYHTDFGRAGISFLFDCLFINPKTWNSLPPDIQKIFNDLEPWLVENKIKVDTGEIDRAIAEAKKLKHTFYHPTPEELQLWVDATKTIHEKWIAENEAKGLPAREIYNEAKRLIANHK